MKNAFLFLLALFVAAYAALLISSHGVLFAGTIEDGLLVKTLKCRYFTGTSVVDKKYLYSESNTIGRAACPRTLYFGDEPSTPEVM